MLEMVHPRVYAPSAAFPSTRPTTAKSALLQKYHAMRATTTCQPKLTVAAMLAKRRGQARRCDRQALIRTVLVRRPASGPSTKAQYLRPTAANAIVAPAATSASAP